jgi:hypothetical protein
MVTNTRARLALLIGFFTLAGSGWVLAQGSGGAHRVKAHDESLAVERCAQCHAAGDSRRTSPSARGGCDAQCVQCHAADTAAHHPTGAVIPPLREPDLQRSSGGRIACRTCHDLSRATTDTVPWRAQSLFDAVFRRQSVYATYHLAMRNQRGQLCQSCH